MKNKKIAVVLCGSGFKDGSEIRESVGVLLALDKFHAEVSCFAPDENQRDVVNCLTGVTDIHDKRNMLVESARIARGKISSLKDLDPQRFDGIILPGGFGAAKNLCDFALKGLEAEVHPDLSRILKIFYEMKKPIGAVCIAPVIVGLVFKGLSFDLTLGDESSTSQQIEKLGHHHRICSADSAVWDRENKIASTPAYMIDQARISDIFKGIEELVSYVLKAS